MTGVDTLTACKAACEKKWPKCEAILFSKQSQCYRKAGITLHECHADNRLDLHILSPPFPPSPPRPPPTPPQHPVARGIKAINEAFRKGKPSNKPWEVGLFMHQWDGQEERGMPWQMCEHNCMCQGMFINGRVSSMAVYQGLRKRADRVGVPLPFGSRGGVILSPTHISIDCMYGIDGGTYRLDNPDHPGCSDHFCSPNNPREQNGLCGFNGAPATAWGPNDMKTLLDMHFEHGPHYHAPGFHSGYNEFIINSKKYNTQLPDIVQAFFVPKGQSPVTGDLGYSIIIDVVQAHRAFIQQHGKSAEEVPLLSFDPFNWEEPFSPYRG